MKKKNRLKNKIKLDTEMKGNKLGVAIECRVNGAIFKIRITMRSI